MRVIAFLLALLMPAAALAADHVRVTIPVPFDLGYAPFYLAAAKGYFAAEGIDAALVGAGGGVATPALISGDVQFSGSPSAAIPAILKGAPLKIIYVSRDRPPYELWASDPAIKTLADLKGRQVGVVSRGDTHENSVRLLLMAAHIDPNSVAYTAMGSGRLAGIASGALPAASLTIDELAQLKPHPPLHRLADTWHQVQMLVGGIAVANRMLGPDRGLARRFMRGLLKGVRYVSVDEDGTIAAMAKLNPHVSAANYRALYRELITDNTSDGTLPPAVEQQMLDLYGGILGMKRAQERPVAAAFDFSLLGEAQRSLDAEGWKPSP